MMHQAPIDARTAAPGWTDEVNAVPKQLLIGGIWRDATGRATFAVENPASGETLCEMADATPADGLAALEAAHSAQRLWAETPPRTRSEILQRAFSRLISEQDRFAHILSLEMGKSFEEARGEVAYAAEFLRWFAEEAVRIHGRYQLAPSGKARHLVTQRPIGPCLLITPWNFPLAMITRKVGPAIAAGCTMILKPAAATPLVAAMFVELLEQEGLPAGVINLVYTSRSSGLVGPLLRDGRLRKLSFTGSTQVGRTLLAGAAENILRCSMELGGNAPFIVFDDADLDAAVEGAVQAKLRNMGQACTAANRFYVQDSVADAFTARLVVRFSQIPLASSAPAENAMGPMINAKARQEIDAIVQDARAKGALCLVGGQTPSGPGYYYPATVLADVPPDALAMHNEIFGPVAPICRFRDEDEVIGWANASDYGLAAYAYTRDLDRAFRLQHRLEAGMFGINTGVISDPAAPFGGVKHSGLGREGGSEGIAEYLTTHYAGIGIAIAA
jgi:succinate-semialdehyde dehydrogenase / glutarate-semialdehyde dehydrogenase